MEGTGSGSHGHGTGAPGDPESGPGARPAQDGHGRAQAQGARGPPPPSLALLSRALNAATAATSSTSTGMSTGQGSRAPGRNDGAVASVNGPQPQVPVQTPARAQVHESRGPGAGRVGTASAAGAQQVVHAQVRAPLHANPGRMPAPLQPQPHHQHQQHQRQQPQQQNQPRQQQQQLQLLQPQQQQPQQQNPPKREGSNTSQTPSRPHNAMQPRPPPTSIPTAARLHHAVLAVAPAAHTPAPMDVRNGGGAVRVAAGRGNGRGGGGGGGGGFWSSQHPSLDPRSDASWQGAAWLAQVSIGVRTKGTRTARMVDGIQPTDVPHMFRVHSTSGQAEFWPVDFLAALCGCPNDDACCSHLWAVAVAQPAYRPKFVLILKARELIQGAAARRLPVDPVIHQLAVGLQGQLPAQTVQAACLVAAEAVVALLLQEEAALPGPPRRKLWWRGGATLEAPPPSATTPPVPPVTRERMVEAMVQACKESCDVIDTAMQPLMTDIARVQNEVLAVGGRVRPRPAAFDATTQRSEGDTQSSEWGAGGGLQHLLYAVHCAAHTLSGGSSISTTTNSAGAATSAASAAPAALRTQPVNATAPPPGPAVAASTIKPAAAGSKEVMALSHAAELLTLAVSEPQVRAAAGQLLVQAEALHRAKQHLELLRQDRRAARQATAAAQAKTAGPGAGPSTPPPDTPLFALIAQIVQRADNVAAPLTAANPNPNPTDGVMSAGAGRVVLAVLRELAQLDRALRQDVLQPGQAAQPSQKLAPVAATLAAAGETWPATGEPTVCQAALQTLLYRVAQAMQQAEQQAGQQTEQQAGGGGSLAAGEVKGEEAGRSKVLPQLNEEAHGGGAGGLRVVDSDTLQLFCQQAIAACDAAASTPDTPPDHVMKLVDEAACRQFGVAAFTDLGYGPLHDFLASHPDPTSSAPTTQNTSFSHALLLGTEPTQGMPPDQHAAQPGDKHLLVSFHTRGCLPHSSGWGGSGGQGHLVVLQDTMAAVAVDTALADVQALSGAVKRWDGVRACRCMLALLVVHGGLQRLPLQLITTCVRDAITAALAATPPTGSHATTDAVTALAGTPPTATSTAPPSVTSPATTTAGKVQASRASYALDVVVSLPQPFRSCRELLQVLLPPSLMPAGAHAAAAAAAGTAADAVLQLAAQLPASMQGVARQALREAGHALSIPAWSRLTLAPHHHQDDDTGTAHQATSQPLPDNPAASTPNPIPTLTAQPPTHTAHNGGDPGVAATGQGPEGLSAGGGLVTVAAAGGRARVLGAGRQRVSGDHARALIEDIRQREFGIGLAGSQEVAAVLSAQHARLRRALDRLSSDLYSRKVHLLLELTQNADDCKYSTQDVPTLGLWVGPSGLAVVSNELGFSDRDVRALCDVGASSKAAAAKEEEEEGAAEGNAGQQGKDREEGGQTGEKGIGFKSVFAVCDQPSISSNGYEFGFDAADPSGIGMVLPHCLGEGEQTSWPCPAVAGGCGWNTHIWLPAASRLLGPGPDPDGPPTPGSWRDVSQELVAGVQPQLMLFLRRVRRLVLHDARQGQHVVHVISRRDENPSTPGLLEVEHLVYHVPPSGSINTLDTQPSQCRTWRWLRGSHTLHHPTITRRGVTVPSTTVVVALPLPLSLHQPHLPLTTTTASTTSNSGSDLGVVDEEDGAGVVGEMDGAGACDVCAYLPIRSFGLGFALQGDWLVPSSREDVLTGEAWNQLLREQVPHAFLRAVELACHHPHLRLCWPGYLPQPSMVQGFFRPLASSVPAALRTLRCVPTACGQLAEPCNVLLATQDVLEVVPEQLLTRVLHKSFAHPALLGLTPTSSPALPQPQPPPPHSRPPSTHSHSHEAALLQLGAHPFTASHLVQLLQGGMDALVCHGVSQAALPNTTHTACDPCGSVTWQEKCERAWKVLALLEQLLTQPSSPGQVVVVPSPSQVRVLLRQLSQVPLILLVDGSWALPSSPLILTPRLLKLVQAADDQQEAAVEAEEEETDAAGSRQGMEEEQGVGVRVGGARVDANAAGGSQEAAAAAHTDPEAAVGTPGSAASPARSNAGQVESSSTQSHSLAGLSGGGVHTSVAAGDMLFRDLPVVDVDGLLSRRLSHEARHRALHLLTSRLQVKPSSPADIINAHVLPTLRAADPHAPLQDVQRTLLACTAYLLHHRHLAAHDPHTAHSWRDAIQWLVTTPPHTLRHAPQHAPQDTPQDAPQDAPSHAPHQAPAVGACGDAQGAGGEGGIMQLVGSSPGVLLGLSFPPRSHASHGQPVPTTNRMHLVQQPEDEDEDEDVDGSGVPAAGVALPAGGLDVAAGSAPWRLPAALHGVMSHALGGVPCCLAAEYLNYGSEQEWGEFLGATLRCGYTLARPSLMEQPQPQPPTAEQGEALAKVEPPPTAGSQHLSLARTKSGALEGSSGTASGAPAGSTVGTAVGSADLARVTSWFEQHSVAGDVALPGGVSQQQVQRALVEMWEVLDSCWGREFTPAPSPAAMPQAPPSDGPSGQQPHTPDAQPPPLPLADLLRSCRCLPVGPSSAAPSGMGDESSLSPRTSGMQLVCPSEGPWAARTPSNTALLGPTGDVFVLPSIRHLDLQGLLHMRRTPTAALLLHQLHRWSERASGPAHTSHGGDGAHAPHGVVQPSMDALARVYGALADACSGISVASGSVAAAGWAAAGPDAPQPVSHTMPLILQALESASAQAGSSGSCASLLRAAFNQHALLAVWRGPDQCWSPPQLAVAGAGPQDPASALQGDGDQDAGADQPGVGSNGGLCWLRLCSSGGGSGGEGGVCWADPSGAVCGTVLPAALCQFYPPPLQQFFTDVLSVSAVPAAQDLLQALRHARQTDTPSAAWACLEQVALSNLQVLPGTQVTTTTEAGKAGAGGGLETAVDWVEVLGSEPLLPCLPWGLPDAGDGSAGSNPLSVWFSTRDPHVYVWAASTLPHVAQVSQADVARLQATASACSQPLHVLAPPAPVPAPASARSHAGDALAPPGCRGIEAGAAAFLQRSLALPALDAAVVRRALDALGAVIDPHALAHQLLAGGQRLAAAGSAVGGHPHGMAANAPSTSLGLRLAGRSGRQVTLHGGACLRPDVATHLTSAMPLVLQYLAAKRPHLLCDPQQDSQLDPLQQQAGAVGGGEEAGAGSVGGGALLPAAAARMAGVLRRLAVVSVPGLQDSFMLASAGLCTEAPGACHQEQDASQAHMTHVLLFSTDACDTPDSGPPPVSLMAWRHLLRSFTSLFSDPAGSPDDDLASLLLIHHSLAGQPAGEVAATLQAIHQLPPITAAGQPFQAVETAQSQWEVGKAWQQPSSPQPTDPLPGTFSPTGPLLQDGGQQPTESSADGWQGQDRFQPPLHNPLALPPLDDDGGGGRRDGAGRPERAGGMRDQPPNDHMGPRDPLRPRDSEDQEQQGDRREGAGGVPREGGPRERLPREGEEREVAAREGGDREGQRREERMEGGFSRATGAAHGFEERPAAGRSAGARSGQMGAFQEEEVEVPSSVRERMAPVGVRPDQGNREEREAVGLWGEEFVAQLMQGQAEPGTAVEWVNEASEQGLPYDVMVTSMTPAGADRHYIEVKATRSSDKMMFEVSHREWLFAQQEGDRYSIYRVMGAGTSEAHVKRINNPYMQWRSQRVGLCLTL